MRVGRGAGASRPTGMVKRNSEAKKGPLLWYQIILLQEGHGTMSPVWVDRKGEQEIWGKGPY
jgi:hypothetical protein